jgi:energy-coupling factor transport system permease protein
MLKDITIGQYYPTASVVHRLDPRLKIFLTMGYIIAVFLLSHFISFLFIAFFTILIAKFSKIPIKFLLKGLKPLIIIMSFTAILNLFMTDGEVVPFFKDSFIKVTYEGINLSIFMLLRIIFLVVGSSFLTYTTSPIEITSGLESLMAPLKKFNFPAHEIAMMMSIALRFIPTLIEETDKIMSAQKARGANLTEGGIIKRSKALIPILIPLFISAFRRADDLAIAMESRCYRGGENRTKLNELLFSKNDIYASFVFLIGISIVVISNYIGVL